MALAPGSIGFVGFNADGADNLAFITFEAIAAGTVITFTDNEWTNVGGNHFTTGESVWTWTATSDIAAGAVITMDNLAAGLTSSSNLGTIAWLDETGRGLDTGPEGVYAFTGTMAAPTFLTFLSNGAANNTQYGLPGTGLTAGVNMTSFGSSDTHDIAVYSGPHETTGNLDALRPAIFNASQNTWTAQNTAGDDSADSVGPDAPFDTTPFAFDPNAQKVFFSATSTTSATRTVTQNEGDSGATIYTFVVERSNGTTGQVNFSGTLTPGANVDAADFGGTIPTTFSGFIADGERFGTVTVTITGDTNYENRETFRLDLTTVANAAAGVFLSPVVAEVRATGAIVNDEPEPSIGFAETVVGFTEGDNGTITATLTVVRTGDLTGNVTYSGFFSRSGTDADDFGGTLPPESFTGTIPAGQSSATFTVTFTGDTIPENHDVFTLQLNSATNSAGVRTVVANGGDRANVYIINDDALGTIHSGETVDGIGLSGHDILTIEQGGTVTGIGVAGHDFDVTINNAGSMGLTGRALIGGLPGNGKITINNAATGEVGPLNVQYPAAAELEFTLNNAGKVAGLSAVAPEADYDHITINNLTGGQIVGVSVRGDTTITNAGTIRVLGGDDDAIEYRNANVVVHNLAGGLIEGGHHAVTGNLAVTVINDEGGTMVGRNGSAVNIDNSPAVEKTVTVINHGVMRGEATISQTGVSDDSDGDAIDIDGLAHIENWGTIEGLGHDGYHNGELNVSEGIAIGGGTIVNHEGGTIYGYGRAIQVDNSSNGNAAAAMIIVNDGTIKGDGNLPSRVFSPIDEEDLAPFREAIPGGEAVDIVGTQADTLTNGATGQIIGGVKMGGGDDVLFNAGTMMATGGSAVDMGAGDDIVTNFLGGVINGAILLGDGDDKFVGNASAENVDGGKGEDLFIGGAGNDTFTGGDGADVYSYVLNDGSDTVVEGAGVAGDLDLLMVDGVEADDVTMYKHGSDVEIVFANGDVVTLKDQLGAGGVENVFFTEDGAIMDRDDIVAHLVNRGPVAVADMGVAGENETKLFDVLANDSDVDGDTLSLSNFSVTGVSGIALDNGQAQGAFSIQKGQLAFNPGTMFDALNDGDTATVTVSYTVDDGHGGSTTADFVLTVNGNTDPNVITGTVGADPLFGTEGVDIVSANDGNDTVFGRGGNDTIDAGNGTDVVFGGAGNDIIDGGDGKDTLMGDAGNDTLAGGQGNDLLYGGEGNDTFVFHASEGRDVVFDFQAGAGAGDVIELDHSLFADFEALMAAGAVTDSAIGAQIAYGDGSTITLSGVHKVDLAIDDFRFA